MEKTPKEQAEELLALDMELWQVSGMKIHTTLRALCEENEVLQKLSSDRAIQRTSLLMERDQLKAKLEAAEKVIEASQSACDSWRTDCFDQWELGIIEKALANYKENNSDKRRWMMGYCKRKGLAPANESAWAQAEQAYKEKDGECN